MQALVECMVALMLAVLYNASSNSYYLRNGATWVMLHKGWMLSRGRSPSETSARGQLTHVAPFLG